MMAIERRLEEYASRDVAVQRYRDAPGVALYMATLSAVRWDLTTKLSRRV